MKALTTFLFPCSVLLALSSCADSTSEKSSSSYSDSAATSEALPRRMDSPAVIMSTGESLGIPAGTAGFWVENAASANAESAGAEAAIILCENGRASYAIFSNQLVVFMKVARSASSEGDVFSFFFDGEDVGGSFRNAGLYTPVPGALLGTGRVEGEGAGVLVMNWNPGKDYIASIRDAAPKQAGRTVFPQKFYHNLTASMPPCGEVK